MKAKFLPLPAHIESLRPYASARSLLKGDQWIFMDANESPVAEDLTLPALPLWNRYPDPTADRLRTAIASYYGLSIDNVIAANGSDELIDLVVRTFVSPGRHVLGLQPSYGMYRVSADINGHDFVTVPLTEDFGIDESAVAEAAENADVLFICNPNNPTGTLADLSLLKRLRKRFSGLMVIDEAYGEFADAQGYPSAIDCVDHGAANLIVLRTFSKAFGAAGIRLGYGIGATSIINVLLKTKSPYNVNVFTQAVGWHLWNERARMEKKVMQILEERSRLMEGCEHLGCRVFGSVTNFFLVQPPAAVRSEELYLRLRDQYRIVLRQIAVAQQFLLRITVGMPHENDALLSSLASLLS
jgi:histidinol-phosphate aminotransferase